MDLAHRTQIAASNSLQREHISHNANKIKREAEIDRLMSSNLALTKAVEKSSSQIVDLKLSLSASLEESLGRKKARDK